MSWDVNAALTGLLGEDGCLFHDKKGRPVDVPAPLAPLADTHAHLTHLHGREVDAATALARAALVGVRLMVLPLDPVGDAHDASSALAEIDRTIEQAGELLAAAKLRGFEVPEIAGFEGLPDLLDNVWVLAGVHPYGAQAYLGQGNDERSDAAFGAAAHEAFEAVLASPRCVGVGEIGLDFGPYNELGREVQLEAFEEQLRRALELGLPVELHLRDEEDGVHYTGHDLALELLGRVGLPQAGCDLHCYTSGPEVLEPFTRLGCYAAFGGAATFSRSDDIRAAAVACPSHLLLSETDTPYMAPVPLRGLTCQPAMVVFSAACLANTRAEAGVSTPLETYRALWENACTFFDRG